MSGIAPLAYNTIWAWAQMTDRHPLPHEVDALVVLDAAMRAPDKTDDESVTEALKPMAWPSKSDG